jgi:ATP-binding cassette subfamily F protein 3
MTPADLLLLDEPTNHLDLETTLWLEAWLRRFPGTLLVIAHDRTFLDAMCEQILHINQGRCDGYRGNYSAFERQRAEAMARSEAEFARQQAHIRHMQVFVDRFRAKASKARQAQSRLKALERMQAVAPIHAQSPYRFDFAGPVQMSYPLITLDDATIGYDDAEVLTSVTLSLLPGARIGVLGANGAGKSTLLKCVVGDLPPQQGEVVRGTHSKVGYFAQHPLESLDAQASALETLSQARPDAREQWCRDYLGRWGFGADKVSRRLTTLSGGEKARLLLALVALEHPAVLILDEPTNHLDLEMREALAVALQDYAGALLLVSHDRALLHRTVDEFWLVKGGRVATFAGGLDDYTAAHEAVVSVKHPTKARKAQRQAAAARRQAERPLRDRVADLETELEQLAETLKALEARLADADIYHKLPADELTELLAEAGRLRKQTDNAEQAWLVTVDELERLAPMR